MKKRWIFTVLIVIMFLAQTGCGFLGIAPQEPAATVDTAAQIANAIAQTQAAQVVVVDPPVDAQQPAAATEAPVVPATTEAPVEPAADKRTVQVLSPSLWL